MRKILQLMTTLLIVLSVYVTAEAQTITYPVTAQPISVAFDSTLLTVNVAGASTTPTVTVTLPTGVFYIPGSFSFIAGSGSVSEGGTAGKPVFSITGATSPFTFTIRRRADCTARTYALGGGTFKDVIKVDGVTENVPLLNNYDVKYATLTITQPASLTNVILGSAQIRTFTIRNSGLGCVDTVFLSIDYSTSGQSPNGSITADGTNFSPDPSLSTSTKKVYKIFGTPNMSGGLCNTDPAINISQPILVTGCTQVLTNYTAGWGTSATNICQQDATTGNLTVLVTAPLLTSVVSVNPAIVPYCSGNPYASFTATITNNGNGPAKNILLYLGNYSGNSVSLDVPYAIDTASILINGAHPAGITVQTVPTSWQLVKSAFNPACIVGQPAQCLITLPANYSLPASGTATVTWNVFTCSGGACDDGFGTSNIGIKMEYDNECVSQHSTSTPQVLPYGIVNNLSGQSMQLPAQVIAGNCFKLLIDFGSSLSSTGSTYLNRYAEVKLSLPTGMTIANLSTDVTEVINNSIPHAGYPKQVGQDVYLRFYPGSANQVKFMICTPVSGPPCGVVPITADITQVSDSTCSIANRFTSRKCITKYVEIFCPGGACPGGGVTPKTFSFYRTSFGLPDNNQDGKPDASGAIDLSKIDQDRYRPGDTLHSEFRGSIVNQTAPSNITVWNNVVAEWSFFNGTWQATTANVTLVRGGTRYSTSGVPISVLTANTGFRANWNGVTFSPAFPAGGYIQGDSVIVTADFIYLPSLNNSGNVAVVSDLGFDVPTTVLLTNTVYATQSISSLPVVTGNTGFTCFIPKYNANVLGFEGFMNVASATSGFSCNSATLGFTSFSRVLGGYFSKQYFLYEYRPIVRVDSVVVSAPQGWEYGGANLTYYSYTKKSGVGLSFVNTITPAITGTTATGYTLKYDINAAYNAGSPWFNSTEGYNFDENSLFRPSCNTPSTASLVAKEYGHFVSYPNKVSPAAYVNTSTINNGITYNGSSKPAILFNNNTGVVEAATKLNNYWDVQITGANFNPAKYIWLATEKLTGSGIDVLRVEYPIGTTLTPSINYGTGKYIYNFAPTATTGLINPNNVVARIYFTKTGCGTDSIKVRSGWDCTAFSTNPNNGCSWDMFLKATSSISEIQLIKVIEPAPDSTVDICNEINYKIKITSTQNGDLDNPVVKINVPAGMNVVSNQFTFQYPDTTNSRIFTLVPTGTLYTLNLEDDTLIPATGLHGLISASGNEQRTAYISFKLRVNSCAYIRGVSPTFQIYGDRPCDEPAIGNGLTVSGNPVKPTPQVAMPSLTETLSISGTYITCSTPVTVTAVINSGNGNTTTGDSAIYSLRPQLKFKTGTFTVTGGNISSYSFNDSVLVVRFPDQIANTVSLQFGVTTAGNTGCLPIDYYVTGNLFRSMNLNCPSSFGSCRYADTTDRDTVRLQIKKPDLSTSAFTFTQTGTGIVTINYIVNITNNGNLAAPGGTYFAEIFCGANSTGKLLYTFKTSAIGIGATVAHTGSFTIDMPVDCQNLSTLFLQVQDTLANGTQACLCSSSTGTISAVLLPASLLHFDAIRSSNTVKINWSIAQKNNDVNYEIERSTDGVHFSTINTVLATGLNEYNTEDNNLSEIAFKLIYYRLKITDISGQITYSQIVKVSINIKTEIDAYPNPVSNKLNVSIRTMFDQAGEIKLTDNLGCVLKTVKIKLWPGTNNYVIDGFENLSGTLFFLQIEFEKEAPERIKIVKR